MTRKQLVTRTEIAKMAGQDKRHFLDHDARHLQNRLVTLPDWPNCAFT